MTIDTDSQAPSALIEPTLEAQAYGDAGHKPHEGPHGGPTDKGGPSGGPKGPKHDVDHHHLKAAEHHERAAEHHRAAASAHQTGSLDQASIHATKAFAHGAHAQHQATDALKRYADKPE